MEKIKIKFKMYFFIPQKCLYRFDTTPLLDPKNRRVAHGNGSLHVSISRYFLLSKYCIYRLPKKVSGRYDMFVS